MSPPAPPGPGMRFAERQLRRLGWRRGQGLGKRGDGIAEAIRVQVKCDTAGVGHDAAESFTFHWWDHIFNTAAANIAVQAGQDSVSVRTVSEQGVSISNKKPRRAGSAGRMLYGRFVKSATLTAHGEEPTGSSEEEEEEEKLDLSSARRLTDEELMRVCGRRTAHKGARHGLTMSAKLARLEEQEQAFLATYRHGERQHQPAGSSTLAQGQGKKKKKKRKESGDGADPEVLQSQAPSREEGVEDEDEDGKVLKRKKKKKKRSQEPSGEEDVTREKGKAARRKKKQQEEEDKEEPVETEKKKKKKRKEEEKENKEEAVETEKKKKKRKEEEKENKEEAVETEKKKKKRRKKEKENKEETAETEVPLEDTDGPDQAGHSPRKKRKKRKREPE
ncbi:G patch domain-containing protein 4 [Aegotheles albertisi]